jgi:hypothetical protein
MHESSIRLCSVYGDKQNFKITGTHVFSYINAFNFHDYDYYISNKIGDGKLKTIRTQKKSNLMGTYCFNFAHAFN